MSQWSDYVTRDQLYVYYSECCANGLHHQDLLNEINEAANKAANGSPFVKCTEEELTKICRQIIAGLEKQVAAALKAPGLTQERLNLIEKAKRRIPHMLPGSGSGQRLQYKDVFDRLLKEADKSSD